MANAFEDCNIRMVTLGETTGWNTPGKGVLLVGNHSSGFEQVPLMAILGGFKRSNLSVIAIPGIGGARTFELLDSAITETVRMQYRESLFWTT